MHILERAATGGPNECWPWLLPTYNNGYARTWVERQGRWRVHRLAYETFVGPLPDGYSVHHVCLNKVCMNPAHLEALPIAEHSRLHHPPGSPGLYRIEGEAPDDLA